MPVRLRSQMETTMHIWTSLQQFTSGFPSSHINSVDRHHIYVHFQIHLWEKTKPYLFIVTIKSNMSRFPFFSRKD